MGLSVVRGGYRGVHRGICTLGHSRECWCNPWRPGIKSEPIEIRNSFRYNLIQINISNVFFYKYFRDPKDPRSHVCAEDNFSVW